LLTWCRQSCLQFSGRHDCQPHSHLAREQLSAICF